MFVGFYASFETLGRQRSLLQAPVGLLVVGAPVLTVATQGWTSAGPMYVAGVAATVALVGVYGLGPSHEVTGSFVGGSRYFNSDGVFAPSGRIDCPGYRYEVRSLRGVSRIKVRIPSRCVGDDLNRNVLVRLIMLDPSEPGRGIYLQLDTREVVSCASSRPVRCP